MTVHITSDFDSDRRKTATLRVNDGGGEKLCASSFSGVKAKKMDDNGTSCVPQWSFRSDIRQFRYDERELVEFSEETFLRTSANDERASPKAFDDLQRAGIEEIKISCVKLFV